MARAVRVKPVDKITAPSLDYRAISVGFDCPANPVPNCRRASFRSIYAESIATERQSRRTPRKAARKPGSRQESLNPKATVYADLSNLLRVGKPCHEKQNPFAFGAAA